MYIRTESPRTNSGERFLAVWGHAVERDFLPVTKTTIKNKGDFPTALYDFQEKKSLNHGLFRVTTDW